MSDLGNKDIFAENLKYHMDMNNKSRKDICNDLGFSYSTFSDWVNGKVYPRIDKIEMLSNYFNINKSDLIEKQTIGSLFAKRKLNLAQQELFEIGKNDFDEIPIVGTIRAGDPILCHDDLVGYIPIMKNKISKCTCYFGLIVKGDSMNREFDEGSTLLIEKTPQVENGELAVVRINGEATVKQVIFDDSGESITLIPLSTNTIHKTHTYNFSDNDIEIIGKVKQAIKNY